MLYTLLSKTTVYSPLMFGASFLIAFFAIKYFMRILPKDQGRKFAVNGALSEGKPRGAGIIMMTSFILCSALFVPFSLETAIYLVLIYAAMLTGFFDDAAAAPWGELKKGLLDLVITAGITVNFMAHNSSDIVIFGKSLHIPAVIFAVLCLILVWASINVTNCCDGVDGMCGSLSCAAILLFILHGLPGDMRILSDIMIVTILAYLWFNCSPSMILMGDAGSRAIGVFLAVISLKSGNPFLFIFFASVIIVDGGLGLLKLSCRRFLKMTNFMENIRTPIHDHWRKNLGLGDTQTVIRFTIIQLAIGLAALYLI
jgi:phospho-N-acetylmuramoyl-pentapeptide-transferase